MSNFAKEYFHLTASSNYIKNTQNVAPQISHATIERFTEQLAPLKKMAGKPKSIVSIGVGEGIEIEALALVYPDVQPTYFGVDISPDVLATTEEYFANREMDVKLIEADATDLPFADNSVDIITMIAILHEVFSYAIDGKDQYRLAIAEAAKKLAENGVLYIRDFSALDLVQDIKLMPKTQLAYHFYNYFRDRYRTFKTFEYSISRSDIQELSSARNECPGLASMKDHVSLPPNVAAEMLLHFKNFEVHFAAGSTFIGDDKWKEINECYLVPDPTRDDNLPMTIDRTVEVISNIAQEALTGAPHSLEVAYKGHSPRPWVRRIIEEHFVVEHPEFQGNQAQLLDDITQFMEIGFKKVRTAH